jgi:uncharacterized protein YbjT (DUF2867 family)|tara:strand:- start:1879 stop:3294 length:1416 start_codon:yes stop_codon:yes gene_type:complete
MNILLTGATGYIGKRLLPFLVQNGHKVYCAVRDPERFFPPESLKEHIEVLQLDLLDLNSLTTIPKEIDVAFYLVHSMSTSKEYEDLELKSAKNFCRGLMHTHVKQVIYLSGIINETKLSKHLASRRNVEIELEKGAFALTTLRAGIIIGSGSASFEIIRDLVEKLPIMITPKWLNTKCQPIGVTDVISFLTKAIGEEKVYNKNFDIGGPEIFTYREMLLEFADERGLWRKIWTVPIMTPRLSSYWLYFVTSTSYNLAVALVNSMKVEVVCRNNDINTILSIEPITYREALKKAFMKIESDSIVSSWKDAQISGVMNFSISDFINVPSYGCFKDERKKAFSSREKCIDKIWRIGGENGWYSANFLWKIRGLMDKMVGGVGLRRGRTNTSSIAVGDALDFWRVLYANKDEGRLLLFAEMKLPGEAWLEFKTLNGELYQTATFRPKGLLGRIYWYLVLPFHGLIFKKMLKKLAV